MILRPQLCIPKLMAHNIYGNPRERNQRRIHAHRPPQNDKLTIIISRRMYRQISF